MAETTKAPEIIPFQLYLEAGGANWHTLNEDDEVNRSNATDESTDGFTIIATLEKAIHGEGKNLNSFIGFHFSFGGASEKRQFKSVTITIRFEDEAKPLRDDPEVVKIWPDTEYAWRGMSKEVEDTKSIEGQLKGGAYGGEGSLAGKWQRQENYTSKTPAKLSGEKTLLKRRAGSHKNAVYIRMSENSQEKSGVFRELRVGILVARKREGKQRFKAYIDIKAEADMRFDVVKGLKKLVGADHVTDPVIFEPGTNYFDADDVAGINSNVPGPEMVGRYGDAASYVEVQQATRRVKKENGEWKEVAEPATAESA